MRFDWLSRMVIIKKLMISGVVMLVLACVAISCYLIADTERLLQQNSRQQCDQGMASIVSHYQEELSMQYKLLDEIYDYAALNDYLNDGVKSPYERYIQFKQTIAPWLEGIRASNRKVDIKIYLPDDYLSIASLTGGKLNQLKSMDWYSVNSVNEDSLHVVCARTYVNGYAQNALIFYKNVWDSYRRDVQRVIVISRSCQELSESVVAQNARYYLTDPSGLVVSTNESEFIGKSLSEMLSRKGISQESLVTGELVQMDGSTYYVCCEPFAAAEAKIEDGWNVLYLQYYDDIAKEIRAQVFRSVGLCSLIVIVALIVVFCISYDITSRLKLLMDKISKLGAGDFSTQISIYGTDEISQISDQFDKMRASLLRLMDERSRTYEELIEYEHRQQELIVNWREAEYQVLRAQINPHYLFNTLESIRMSFLVDQEREAARIVRIFAESMRRYMDVGRKTAFLEEELIYVGYYMEIQRFRMGDRISYVKQVDPELLDVQIPCLVLQPLVENAVNHGIDSRVEGGTVYLNIRREGDWMVAEVCDDGIGMSPEHLARIRSMLSSETAEAGHVGLRNINRRMMLLYGEQNKIQIESEEGKGTVTTVRFLITEEGEGADV